MASGVRSAPASERGLWGWLQGFDGILLGSMLGLIGIGAYSILSVSRVDGAEIGFNKYLFTLLIGIVPFLTFWLTPHTVWEKTARPIYALNLLLLLAVFFVGERDGGAVRWLDIGPLQFQPSEFSKLATVFTLSSFFTKRLDDLKKFSTFGLSFLHILPTVVLLVKQPHYGAATSVLVSWLAICLIAGVPWKYVLITLSTIAALFTIGLNTNFILRDYHRERIQAMFAGDEQDSAYQQMRSEVAFGVGGTHGTGFFKGEQKASQAIPEQESDFIFTVVGEELGLVGTTLTLALYGIFFIRGWLIVLRLTKTWARMTALGLLTMLAFHMIVNVQMVLGIGPVIGLWLPFISYGGTALWMCLASVGLILNMNASNAEAMFSTGSWGQIAERHAQNLRKIR